MSDLLLSDDERRRFIDYCRREVDSLNAMATQMQNLPSMPPHVLQHYKIRAAAYILVASDLDRVESVTMRGKEGSDE